MKSILFITLALNATILFAQNGIVGSWYGALDQNEGFDHEELLFMEDGHYYGTIHYLNGAEYGIGPDYYYGFYEFDGTTLSLYNLHNDQTNTFPISNLNRSGFTLYNQQVQSEFQYEYRGAARPSQAQRESMRSWENFRKLGGIWQSEETILKVLPDLGIVIIRLPGQTDFFKWGQYTVNGNQLSLTEISAEQNTFYTGQITQFHQKSLSLVSQGKTEQFVYQGAPQLDETEMMMVQQYMNMTHRLNMSIIDMIDGQQDFIWKRVEERY